MEFKSIIKSHGLNPSQFIYPKPNSHWQYPKPNFHWHYFIKKEAQDYQCLAKKNIMVKYYCGKKDHGNHLIKNSLRVVLRIMFSNYKPMKYMDIICITSIIYAFNTRGKTFIPTSSSFKL